jgi:hypothetical protein
MLTPPTEAPCTRLAKAQRWRHVDVVFFYVDNAAQNLLVTVETEALFTAALDRLAAGAAWAAAGSALTHGWAVTEALTSVRVSNVPPFLTTVAVIDHMLQFGHTVPKVFSRCELLPVRTGNVTR